MKTIIKTILSLILCFFILILASKCTAQFTKDKQDHFAVGSFIGAASSGFIWGETGKRWLAFSIGTGLGTCAGVAKELYDQNKGREFSKPDLKYTIIGSLAGSVTFQIVLGRKAVHRKNVPINLIVEK